MPDLAEVHRRLLERRRKVANLVGPGDVGLHFDDCALALSALEPVGSWADLGSGAGFPGLVFAARYPGVPIDLVERRAKRAVFLEQVLLEAEAPRSARVLRQSVEDLPDASYDGVLTRAFAPPAAVLEHGERLLRPAGLAVLLLQDDQALPPHPAFEVFHVERYRVAGKDRRSVAMRRR